MSMRRLRHVILAALALTCIPLAAAAQTMAAASGIEIARRYRVVPNITYVTANNFEAKLDVYTPRDPTGPVPTIIYIHGGWWLSGSKEGSMLNVWEFLQAHGVTAAAAPTAAAR